MLYLLHNYRIARTDMQLISLELVYKNILILIMLHDVCIYAIRYIA
jgi:hypothetical protein